MRQRQQLVEQRLKVDFDTYDVTVDELIRRVEKGRIEIAPVYQRQFRWDPTRQSRLIESLLLGIPVPPLFMATNWIVGQQVQWEVVDGLQRLLTLVNFAGDQAARSAAALLEPPLQLGHMEKLTELNGYGFSDLTEDIRTALEDRPIKIIVLNDKSDLQVRFDLFERLNTGGIRLTDQEVRECVYRGDFMNCVATLASSEEFKTILRLPESKWKDGTPEEYVLRFFAFLERYLEFDHSVKDFLNEFTQKAALDPRIEGRATVFKNTFEYLAKTFPDGIKSRKGITPVNLFEGLAVGAALALNITPSLNALARPAWVQSEVLRRYTTGPTNSKPRVRGRIEFCRDKFLGVI